MANRYPHLLRWTLLGVALLTALFLIPTRGLKADSSDDKDAGKAAFGPHDKAFYADPKTVAFVRPGLQMSIQSASIAADGTVKVRYKLTDPRGLPLDRLGVFTPGTVSTSFLVGVWPKDAAQYTSYITRVQASTTTGRSATQATSDSGGTFAQVGDGEYEYTFRNRAPSGYDRSATHIVGIYGSRNLSEFDLGTQFDDDTFTFVPDGSGAPRKRELIKTETCNGCHDPLGEHGGSRKSVELCNICHTPQTTDPDTGNTVDMPVMIHKIHMGSQLPSVVAGGKYQIIGNANSVHDYSAVVFPADARNCASCHKEGVAQPNQWMKPTRAACGSCHDDVNFATGQGHANLPQLSDNLCANCHTPQGELPFDVSIKGAHTIPRLAEELPGLVFTLNGVEDATAGKRPVVTFTLKDKAGNPVAPNQLNSLRLSIAGPTTDYTSQWAEDPRTAATGGNGTYRYTFTRGIPADAKGTFAFGIEGYRNINLLPGTTAQVTVRDAGRNQVIYASVDGSRLETRRGVVDEKKCLNCHASGLSFHGDQRNSVEYCVTCHNPTATDIARRPADQRPAESIDFRTMVHKIHSGANLANGYTVYGFGGTKYDFGHAGYPGDRRNCTACHVNNSEQLPLRDNLSSVSWPRTLDRPIAPMTAACNSCHDARSVLAHAVGNTNELGETCGVCHSSTSQFSVNKAHAR